MEFYATTVVLLVIFIQFSHGYTEGSVRDTVFGPLEIFHDGQWGAICQGSIRWSQENVLIACNMMGHKRGFLRSMNNYRNKTAVLRGVYCTGSEKNIEECVHDGWGKYNCTNLISVFCFETFSGNACSGRVCEDFQNTCCENWRTSHCCTRYSTTTVMESTEATTTNTGDIGFLGLKWWWITLIIVGMAIFALALLRIRYFCRRGTPSRRTAQHRSTTTRSDIQVVSTQQVIYRTQHVDHTVEPPVDLPPSYSDLTKGTQPPWSASVFSGQNDHEPPPPYHSA